MLGGMYVCLGSVCGSWVWRDREGREREEEGRGSTGHRGEHRESTEGAQREHRRYLLTERASGEVSAMAVQCQCCVCAVFCECSTVYCSVE